MDPRDPHDRQKQFLAALPLCVREERHVLRARSADKPERWTYVDAPGAAKSSIEAAGVAYTFCGHVHDQTLSSRNARASERLPSTPGTSIPAGHHRRWLAIAGSAGPSHATATRYRPMPSSTRRASTSRSIAWPTTTEAAADKIQRAGLPASLAYRVRRGI
jgi:hypothetical protein